MIWTGPPPSFGTTTAVLGVNVPKVEAALVWIVQKARDATGIVLNWVFVAVNVMVAGPTTMGGF